ncbi:MAG TPA: hypothetical protein VJW55_18005, partial [Candidatus Angelobacter sp.]|nr:hypothetical protein [Candidatus Angelobacter sp.]
MRTQPKQWPQPRTKATLHTMPAPAAAPSWFERLFQGLNVPGEIKLPNGRIVATGKGVPRFR